jgi:starvation-inducible DNA-binding protein
MKKISTAPTSINKGKGNAVRATESREGVDTGIEPSGRTQVAGRLAKVLAESYALYTKTQGYHWNVTGPQFPQLHLLFEGQYTELAAAVDEIAERIRALGAFAPGDMTALRKLATIADDDDRPKAAVMVQRLLDGHETVTRLARESISVAEDANDAATADLLTTRASAHEKAAWMLRSVIE